MSTASTYPHWLFDGSPIPDPMGHGERAVQFLRALKHPASTAPKRALQLAEWQERIVRRIYGPVDEDGERMVREVFLMIPRGNRKTSLAAALSILHLLGPQKLPGGQIIFAAADRKQSSIGFREAANIVREDRHLVRATKIYDPTNAPKTIKSLLDGSTLEAASSDGKAMHGTTPTFVLVDEIHAWRSAGRELWEALQSGMAKRPGGLTVIATTAGRGREGLAAERYAYARKVALGEIDNPSFLPIIFEPEKGDDWQDEVLWHKVNPGLSLGFHDLKKLRTDAKEAVDNHAKRYEFQQYNLNTWHGNSRDPLFNFDTYDARQFEDDETDLEALPCYLGVDYAQSGDLAAVVAAWRYDDGQITIKPWFIVAGEGLQEREKNEGRPYQRWIDEGHLTASVGPVIPQQDVQDLIREICARHNVEQIAYDPWKFQVAATELHGEGLPMVEMRQGSATMGPATGELVRAVNGRRIRHNGSPVLRDHFAGVAAVAGDAGNIRMTKADPKHDHIDGAVTSAMAVSRAVAGESNKSHYSDPNFKSLADLLEE
ncbi:MAG: terminase large subunit [Pseudophaeobacter sp. bin_em_oilr2.035]|uniref:Terminase large subunit n=1 Tax=Phaeobacter gallaeciensis TaxID=60890 RepID=A0ABD4X432_9RHOB|nr:terminase TerL endonuclease subunit [Phaeobacter gallaeciensis]MDF1770475.1 terminase large subunit [Pseudophaeobacter sp. bin_em_oilr2.035]MDE4143187.1 terminase large subunit [Phaeobacter gallaeciensis]MDE4156451.1 terminase large subunit [Phaeobacter gallaeciensis]MDE4160638.1 terminase large subunit [Phaeobacter gallaeciensis]MDE4164268.1 terminase large subunit [Phaeobacter gallaeciensis]